MNLLNRLNPLTNVCGFEFVICLGFRVSDLEFRVCEGCIKH
jgi:hypothetical protein